jgi:hypothetical protein
MPLLETLWPNRPARASNRPPVPARPPSRVQAVPVGLAVGTWTASLHALWVGLVATGAAQPVTDFLFRLHGILPAYRILPLRARPAAGLVLLSAAIGFLYGLLGAALWNVFAARSERATRRT